MKKFDYYLTFDKEFFTLGFAVEFAGDKPRLKDRYFIPVSKRLFIEIYDWFNRGTHSC